VIGLPGETVDPGEGTLSVDGVGVAQPYPPGPADTRDHEPVELPNDELFVLGDRRTNSNDTRFGLGFIPQDKVIGRPLAIVWRPSRAGWTR
jgi:signal peptidase I